MCCSASFALLMDLISFITQVKRICLGILFPFSFDGVLTDLMSLSKASLVFILRIFSI